MITFDEYPLSRILKPMLTVVDIDVFNMGYQTGKSFSDNMPYILYETGLQRKRSRTVEGRLLFIRWKIPAAKRLFPERFLKKSVSRHPLRKFTDFLYFVYGFFHKKVI